eukprot:TRINITY_DN12334_c0_g1_i1.p1 TRINITY_DN12334_c0_g1~~TRINITY_DN12334_c0_g1_i1.p1  ORF type:complete len:101 (-),score=26.98 TRINITY_DN12334_c0_g1_i1:57-359(-)
MKTLSLCLTTLLAVTPSMAKDFSKCHGVAPYAGNPGIDGWCQANCKQGFCPATHCFCPDEECRAVNQWKDMNEMHEWCKMNCKMGYCPESYCNDACRKLK